MISSDLKLRVEKVEMRMEDSLGATMHRRKAAMWFTVMTAKVSRWSSVTIDSCLSRDPVLRKRGKGSTV